ncbi:MAG TPA: queuosine precursor transporter [Flavisolibacter sp.]|nr:queuosine precursor transporter [Flavisolibacter sp.]
MLNNILNNKATRLFIILGGLFITNALIAEVIGTKIFSLEKTLGISAANIQLFGESFSFNLTAGVLLWPVVFIMTDIINEYYGPKGVRFLSFLTIALITFSFLAFFGATHLVPADFWATNNYKGVPDSNAAFAGLFGQSQAIIIASLIAFLIGQLLDVFIFHKIKKATGEKRIWLRATGSTLVSQFIDSFVVLFIAFYVAPRLTGDTTPWSFSLVMAICVGNYIYKFIVAVVLTPVIYLVHGWIENYLGAGLAKEMKQAAMGRSSV